MPFRILFTHVTAVWVRIAAAFYQSLITLSSISFSVLEAPLRLRAPLVPNLGNSGALNRRRLNAKYIRRTRLILLGRVN